MIAPCEHRVYRCRKCSPKKKPDVLDSESVQLIMWNTRKGFGSDK